VPALRAAVVVGGNRIPFARTGGAYTRSSNQDMLGAALEGLIARFGLQDERIGEVAAGAVLKHSRDFNLTREVVLGSALAAETPAYDLQQACATGLEAVLGLANKIKLGQIDSAIAGGVDSASDAPIAVSEGRPEHGRAADRPVHGRTPGAHHGAVEDHPRGPGRAGLQQPPEPRRRL
jgi:acetyl-CoA C-acetyltransferase